MKVFIVKTTIARIRNPNPIMKVRGKLNRPSRVEAGTGVAAGVSVRRATGDTGTGGAD